MQSAHSNQPKARSKTGTGSLYGAVIIGGILFALIRSFTILSPILFSLLLILIISLAVNPLVRRIRTFVGGRKAATALLAVALIGVLALVGWAFMVPMKSSVIKLSEKLPHYWERLQKPLIRLEKKAVLAEKKLQAEVTTEIARATNATGATNIVVRIDPDTPASDVKEGTPLRTNLGQMVKSVAGGFSSLAVNTAQMGVILVTVFFGVIFTLMNPRPIIGTIFSVIPSAHHDRGLVIMQKIGKFMPSWAYGTLLAMSVIGVMVFLIMWPIFGFTDALVLGLVAGILEAVPYIGPTLSIVPALLFALGKGGATPVWVLGAYLAVQALENNVICPLIMARSMKLNPVAVIFSMLVCVAVFGVLGVLVAPPMVAITMILHEELYRKRFLPSVGDADLERLARLALREPASEGK